MHRVVGLEHSSVPDGAEVEAFAPGRVNLIGEHTDYSGGLALPMAIQLGTTVRVVRTGADVELASTDLPGAVRLADVADGVADATSVAPSWGTYVAGVVVELAHRGEVHGAVGTVSSSLPVGAGLSSSAALELSVALAIGFRGHAGDLARLGQRAEQAASGVPCGLLDQLASACGTAGHALLIDFSADGNAEPVDDLVAIPDDLEVVVLHSGESRTLAGSAYADRRSECERAAEHLGPLRHADPDAVERLADAVLRKRARHVVNENARVLRMADALRRADLVTAGELLGSSHASLRDDFEVSTPTLDRLVAELDATPGVFGARLTGAGFGGCVVAFTTPGTFAASPGVWPVTATDGATVSLTSG